MDIVGYGLGTEARGGGYSALLRNIEEVCC